METKMIRHSKSLLASFSSSTSERGSWQRKKADSNKEQGGRTDSVPETTTRRRRPYNHGLPPTVRLEGPLLKELKKHKKAGKVVAGPRGIIRRTSSKVKHLTHALLYQPSSFSSSSFSSSSNTRQNLLLENRHGGSAYDSNSSLESTIAVATASQTKNKTNKEEQATLPPSPRTMNRVHFDELPPTLIPPDETQPKPSPLSSTSASSLSSSQNNKKKKKTKHKKHSRRSSTSSSSSKCSKKMSQSNQAQLNQDESFDTSSSSYDPCWYGPEDYVRFRKTSKQTVVSLDQEEDETWKDPTSRVNLLLALHQCTTSSAATNMTVEEQPDDFSGDHSYFLTETQLARFDGLYDGDQDEEIEDEEDTLKFDGEDIEEEGDFRNTSSFSLLGMEGDMQIQLEQDKHQRRVNQYHLVHEIQTIAAAQDTPADRLASVLATACARLSGPAGRLALFYGQSLEKSLLTVNGAPES